MKIGIDIRALNGSKYGGVREYINNLLPQLFKLAPHHSFYLFQNSRKHILENPVFSSFSNVKLKIFNYPSKLFNSTSRYLHFPKADKMLGGVDVFFSPHFIPISTKCPRITTFHDISFEFFPEFFDFRRRFWHKYIKPKYQAESSDIIISVSDSTKDDLVEAYRIPPQKITTIHSGVNHLLLNVSQDRVSNVMKKYNLPEIYLLSLSTIEPRKNIISLIRAFNILAEYEGFSSIELVIAGMYGWSFKNIIEELEKSPFKNRIHFIGSVEEEEKAILYKNAKLFIYPSFYEGFGFPPLEAMYSKVPTVVSMSSSLSEIVAGAAILVDPTRPKEIAQVITELLVDERLFNYFSDAGHQRAKEFTWELSAQKTFKLIEETARRGRF